jgi:glutathione S-transferase
MEICSEKYTFKCLDTLRNKHLDEPDFLKANPTLDIPVIVESHYSIISGPTQYVSYLIQTRETVRKTLYPSESKTEIDRNI